MTVEQQMCYPAPTVLPDTTIDMKFPGFWISKHPAPDKTLLTGRQIFALNVRLMKEKSLVTDVTSIRTFRSHELQKSIRATLKEYSNRHFYFSHGENVPSTFYQEIEHNIHDVALSSGTILGYGFTTGYTNVRILPSDEVVSAQPGEIEFDELQNDSLDIATPVATVCYSSDRLWQYVISPTSEGWVHSHNVAVCGRHEVLSYFKARPFIVITKADTGLFADKKLTEYCGFAMMGVRFPGIVRSGQPFVEITVPARTSSNGNLVLKTMFVNPSDVHMGYLAYTPRTIINQAFELLNAPYGWGGFNGEPDCSRFIQAVFSTVGIHLPRNSHDQSLAGNRVVRLTQAMSRWDKMEHITGEAVGGSTLLYMKGHIMLFLGLYDGNPYAISSLWAYGEKGLHQNRTCVVNRVAVTDLSLGDGTQRGSFLDRLTTLVQIGAKN
jgi:hypothetical protein